MAVGASLPARRAAYWSEHYEGSPWFVLAIWRVMRHPVAFWSTVWVHRETAWWHQRYSLALASLSLVIVFGLLEPLLDVGSLLLFFAMYCLLELLCAVESFGIRFFGRRNRWRVTKDVATTVIGFSAFAWILTSISLGVVWGLFARGVVHQAALLGPISTYLLAMFLAFLPGLLWFETLVWIGVRKLRYANIPGSERHLADSTSESGGAGVPPAGVVGGKTGGTPVPPAHGEDAHASPDG